MPAIQIGSPFVVLDTPTTASLGIAAASGGSGNFSYQWHRSTVYNFTPSSATALTGQTALQIIDSPLRPNTIYYYAVVVTDLGPNPPTPSVVTSGILGLCTLPSGQLTYTNPQVVDFQDYFDRDFPFGSDIDTDIRDKDVLKGMQQANDKLNIKLFIDQAEYNTGFLLLSAHYLATNLAQSSQGINGQYDHLLTSKGGGGVSAGISIPDLILKNPTFAGWAKTTYGYAYLTMIIPRLYGPAASVQGQTKP